MKSMLGYAGLFLSQSYLYFIITAKFEKYIYIKKALFGPPRKKKIVDIKQDVHVPFVPCHGLRDVRKHFSWIAELTSGILSEH